ncbi:MAG TPA: UDP-N-acetylglucosamine--N-acetylmuramyl-(pentapeptide) pyrophosphoryl-undecaprenol N-acetylglucosamine transferase [Acidimicrobiales bacterium]|nr:UDP-N-acetylglucosamine--N-acetylmuramyl-(pentapeptide) pyrophosphoryl-undecaprenol N-acetylglucosamine transferase [Acidimicrobiales bacterium]
MTGPVVITGGGTGGHVFPMQAVADALRDAGLTSNELRFVGSRRGQERRLLANDSVALTLLPGRGLRRSWRANDVVANVGAAVGLLSALARALVLVRRWRPSVVVSVGGYASFAVSVAAMCWRRPLVLVELDAAPGAAQRFVAHYATKRCCAFPIAGDNVVVTGAPLRAAIEHVDRSKDARDAAKAALVPPIDARRMVVVVMTGSLGSTRVNRAVRELAVVWSARSDRAILHVTGRRDFDEMSSKVPASDGLDYRVLSFGDMVELWTLSDVAICRAGAVTVAELTALSIPSVLVPLPGAPGDHQTRNAETVVGVGGAQLLRDKDCTGATLAELLDTIMDPMTLASMTRGAATLAKRGAARDIASVILDVRGTP